MSSTSFGLETIETDRALLILTIDLIERHRSDGV